MFTKEALRKYNTVMWETIETYNRVSLDETKLCISEGNSKIGRVLNISTPPVLTCPNCAECTKLCYDIKACLFRPEVMRARARNFSILVRDRNRYFDAIKERLKHRRKRKFFRWHVGGEIIDIDYFNRMVEIARDFPDWKFWTYTKNYAIVNQWINNHGKSRSAIPRNLTVMFSEWKGMEMINPYGLPEFRVIFAGESAPDGARICPGNCEHCIEHNCNCVRGETVYCHEH